MKILHKQGKRWLKKGQANEGNLSLCCTKCLTIARDKQSFHWEHTMNQFMLGHCECPSGSEWEASERYVLEECTQRGTEMASLAKTRERSI